MANPSSNSAPKPYKQNQAKVGAVRRVYKKHKQKPKGGSWLTSLLAMAALLGSAGLVVTFAWVSIQFILNPYQVGWVNKLLPGWAQISLDGEERPQTLKQIQDGVKNQGFEAGNILPLEADTAVSFLLPVFKQRSNCQSNCKSIVELRVYQRSKDLESQSASEKYYYLATQVPVTGPEESFVVAPFVKTTDENQGSSLPLPLDEVGRFGREAPSPGAWFYLQGHRQQGTNVIAYGHIFYYNPERTNLQFMLPWTSPNGYLPQWRQVTGGGKKELVVDQTVGLEPQLKIYQVKSVKSFLNPIELEVISLTPPALKNSAYQDALSLARSGLWTSAFERLQSLNKRQKGLFSVGAQAQMDFIRLHSQLTKTQANTSWASPSQQVLADIMDGRWEKALQVFEASPQNAQEISTLLKADGERLSNRVAAELRVNPKRQSVQAWGALIVAARHGQARANTWLSERVPIEKDTVVYIQSLIELLNGNVSQSKVFSSEHTSRIVGSVQPIAEVNPKDWLKLDNVEKLSATNLQGITPLEKADNQVWYQVQVSAFHNGQNWLSAPFANLKQPESSPEKFFQKILGVNSNLEIQIVVWLASGEQMTTTATIKAVQLRDGVLRLLVSGDASQQTLLATSPQQPPPLALTDSALEWVQPSPITLGELYKQDSSRVKAMLSTIWKTLQESGELPDGNLPETQQLLQHLEYWPVQEIDLTGNGKPETVVTLSPEAIASLYSSADANEDRGRSSSLPKSKPASKNPVRPRTLILSDGGQVVYTDFKGNSQQALTAIARLLTRESLALLVENSREYSLKVWSEKNKRFE
ncbi:hypothetical protein NUACC21_62500 [Scytonema sp. NUACC21]